MAVCLLALAGGGNRATSDDSTAKAKPRPGRAVLVVMDEVVERSLPSLLESPADAPHRVSVKNGLVGLGRWSPPGGDGYGVKAPPLRLFPSAGAGNSLNVDPTTGRSYFGPP